MTELKFQWKKNHQDQGKFFAFVGSAKRSLILSKTQLWLQSYLLFLSDYFKNFLSILKAFVFVLKLEETWFCKYLILFMG